MLTLWLAWHAQPEAGDLDMHGPRVTLITCVEVAGSLGPLFQGVGVPSLAVAAAGPSQQPEQRHPVSRDLGTSVCRGRTPSPYGPGTTVARCALLPSAATIAVPGCRGARVLGSLWGQARCGSPSCKLGLWWQPELLNHPVTLHKLERAPSCRREQRSRGDPS